ncbi:MAG: hypothetical protein CM1200mP26_19920 [Acidimicrobiales bacterium]|nr:MAG: hypothetical protein CM1200mP26_19920 [Acidimicrobiales bacterium]
MNEFWEVQLELVLIAHRVRALHFAEFALEALVHDLGCFGFGDGADVAVVSVVQK